MSLQVSLGGKSRVRWVVGGGVVVEREKGGFCNQSGSWSKSEKQSRGKIPVKKDFYWIFSFIFPKNPFFSCCSCATRSQVSLQ